MVIKITSASYCLIEHASMDYIELTVTMCLKVIEGNIFSNELFDPRIR